MTTLLVKQAGPKKSMPTRHPVFMSKCCGTNEC